MPDGSKLLSMNQIATPLLAVAAMTALCYFAAPILVPLVAAGTLSFILWPGVAVLRRLKVPHVIAVLIMILIAIIALTAIGMLIYSEAINFASNLPGYWDKFQQLRQEHADKFPKFLDFLWQDKGESIFNKIDVNNLSSIPKFFFKGVGSVLSFLGQAALIVMLTVFMLIEQRSFRKRLTRTFGTDKVGATTSIITQISNQIAGYLMVRFAVTVCLAVIFTVGLLIGGVQYPYVWGPLAALLNLVPYVGAYVGAAPPMIMAFIQFNSIWSAIWVLLFFMAIQAVESNFITPKLLGKQLNINLLAQLISTIYWGWLWGAVGIVLAVPITATFKVVCDNVEALHPIGILLSGDQD